MKISREALRDLQAAEERHVRAEQVLDETADPAAIDAAARACSARAAALFRLSDQIRQASAQHRA